MATQLQLRRGTTAENDVFTGAVGELTMCTNTNGLRIHDGNTTGGFDVPTAATADYVVEWQAPTDLNNYTWYRKYKSGWIEQGGYSSATTGTVNITLPVEMLSNVYNIQTQALVGSAVSDTTSVNRNAARAYIRMPSNQTTTGFSFPASGDMGQIGTYWQVCGMAA